MGEYDLCEQCTVPIAEAQQAYRALTDKAETIEDGTVVEHVTLAAELCRLEAEAAEVRAKLHNGHGTEPILNTLLGFLYDRGVREDISHSHHRGQ